MKDKTCINCIHKDVCYKYRLNYISAREGNCTDYYERPHGNCVLTLFGDCSYQETGCSDCKIKQKIREALKNERPQGEWIKKVDEVGFISYICSNCGFELELEDCSDSYYCTICGADMRGNKR